MTVENGTTILTATNTYSGPTTVNGGTLAVNGSIANSAVTVNAGGTLGGNGTVGNTTINGGGVLAPGNSIGTLTVGGNLAFSAGSIYRVEVSASAATAPTSRAPRTLDRRHRADELPARHAMSARPTPSCRRPAASAAPASAA